MFTRVILSTVLLSLGTSIFAQVPPRSDNEQITVAQLSDTHIGDKHAPHAKENLQRAVEMINERHPDAVILSGDIGENREAWEDARSILQKLKAPLYYVPGNHDVHSKDVERYRDVFGKDYYDFKIKFVRFIAIDSELLGNFDVYDAKTPMPLPPQTEDESERMFGWLAGLNASEHDANSPGRGRDQFRKEKADGEFRITIGVQHIPVFHDGNYPPDRKPYWVISDPYRSKEMKALHELGIKHMLVGHWHNGRVFDREGITWHVAPSTSWLPWGGELGFALHTVSANGDVRTDFIALPDAAP